MRKMRPPRRRAAPHARVAWQERIEALQDDITIAAVEGVLAKLPSQPTRDAPLFAAKSTPATPAKAAPAPAAGEAEGLAPRMKLAAALAATAAVLVALGMLFPRKRA